MGLRRLRLRGLLVMVPGGTVVLGRRRCFVGAVASFQEHAKDCQGDEGDN